MISFHNSNISFNIQNRKIIKAWLADVISSHNKKQGEIAFIFTDDKNLLKINNQYLNHDYYTDIITFDYCEKNIISSDIFISVERVKDNSILYNVSFHEELLRVIVHGILHLLGYNDHTDEEKKEMRKQEDFYLNKLDLKNKK